MLTEFGKFCRILRIERGELLKDMAEKLKVSPAFLSAVEVGKRSIPPHWREALTKAYSLGEDQVRSLEKAIQYSKASEKMDLKGLSMQDRDLVMSFARKFKNLDDTTKDLLISILKRV